MQWEVQVMYRKHAVNQIPSNFGGRIRFAINWKSYTSLVGLALLVIISAIMSPTFLSPFNIINVATQISAPGILAIGMTFVILTAGIDLSAGSLLALTGVLIAVTAPVIGWEFSVLLAVIAGALIGGFHGFCITRLKVPPFIVTLAGLSAYKGLALIITGSASVPLKAEAFDYLGSGRVSGTVALIALLVMAGLFIVHYVASSKNCDPKQKLKKMAVALVSAAASILFGYLIYQAGGLPIQVIIFILVLAIAWFVLNKTIFGREMYAIGGNPEAARLAGVKVNRGLVIVYASAGFLSAIAGVLVATRLGSGTPQVGTLSELDAIAAVVIGGTSLMGGIGKLGGTVIGVILIGILNNLLSLLNITADMQMVFKGAIILGAVILDARLSKK